MGSWQPLEHGSTFMYRLTELNSQRGRGLRYIEQLDLGIRLITGTDSCVWVLVHKAVPGKFLTSSKYFCFSLKVSFFK